MVSNDRSKSKGVQGGTDLPRKKGGASPTRTTLRKRDVIGFVPDRLWKALTDDPALRTDLTERLLNSFWPETRHAAIRAAIGLPDVAEAGGRPKAPRDPRFREHVLRAYDRRCAICGYDGRLADSLLGLEAAHVRWHAYDGPDEVANGIALCAFHHTAFDADATAKALTQQGGKGALSFAEASHPSQLALLWSAGGEQGGAGGKEHRQNQRRTETQVDELLRNFMSKPLRRLKRRTPNQIRDSSGGTRGKCSKGRRGASGTSYEARAWRWRRIG